MILHEVTAEFHDGNTRTYNKITRVEIKMKRNTLYLIMKQHTGFGTEIKEDMGNINKLVIEKFTMKEYKENAE